MLQLSNGQLPFLTPKSSLQWHMQFHNICSVLSTDEDGENKNKDIYED